jgi:hypothetical protein
VEWQRGAQDIAQEQLNRLGAWLVFIPLCFMERHGGQLTPIYLIRSNNEL